MHILLIHQAFAALDEPGGTRHHEFARLLADRGHKVSIIASPVSYLTGSKKTETKIRSEIDGKITIYRAYTYPALHKSFFHRLVGFFSFMISSFLTGIRVKNVDIVWGTSPPIFQSVTAWLLARLKGAKFLLEIRDLWPDFAVAVGVLKNKILIRLSQWLERFLYRHADHVVVNSPGYIDHVRARGAKTISMIPNGADESYFNTGKKNKREELGWGQRFVALYAGAHGMSNDLETVLYSAKLLRDDKNIQFVFLGDGKEKNNLIAKSHALELNNILFLDPVPKSEIADYLHAADACLAILKPIEMYKTTYPNKVFDYMAAGKPVILAIDGVIRDVVKKAQCGIYCEPGNPQTIAQAILTMFNTAEPQRKKMGESGKDYLKKNFDRKKVVKIFSDMIEKMVESNV